MGIKASGRLGVEKLGVSLIADDPVGPVTLDLAGVTFFTPGGLVAVAASIEQAHRASRPLAFTPPEVQDCQSYLSRMGLREVLGEYYELSACLPEVKKHQVDSLCELRHFEGEDDLESVVTTLMDLYKDAGGQVPGPLYQSLFETASNAVEHSGVDGGWVALQMFRRSDEVAVATADCGVGLKAKLNAATDGQAIVTAARLHESSTGVAGRGRGITSVVELTKDYGGHVVYVTGTATGKFTGGNWDPGLSTNATPFAGTLAETCIGRRRQV